MRFPLSFGLVVFGMLLLATPALPLGLLLVLVGWWVSAKSKLSNDSSGFTTVLMLLGGLGAALVYLQAAWQFLGRL
jgi:VIT1/CCC1 family predicted Fe2+/Mn2+ transporter